jgi:hypothetical protein
MGLFTADIKTMDDLFVHQLKDIYYAEKRIVGALPKMIETPRDELSLAGGVPSGVQLRAPSQESGTHSIAHCSGVSVGKVGAGFGFTTAAAAASAAFFAALHAASCASFLVAKSFAAASIISAGEPSRPIRRS